MKAKQTALLGAVCCLFRSELFDGFNNILNDGWLI